MSENTRSLQPDNTLVTVHNQLVFYLEREDSDGLMPTSLKPYQGSPENPPPDRFTKR